MNFFSIWSVIVLIGLTSIYAGLGTADNAATDKTKETTQDISKHSKKVGRKLKDAVCTKGDIACAAQKGKHKLKNAKDEFEDKAGDLKKELN